MDRPEVKSRAFVSYVVVAVCLIGLMLFTNYMNNTANENAAAEDPAAATEQNPAAQSEVTEPTLDVNGCTYSGYHYRVVSDIDELSALGLPGKVEEGMIGGEFGAADNRVTLYAYPALACRAYLIAGRDELYSFAVLDSFTEDKAGNAGDIAPMYGIYSAADAAKAVIISSDGEERTLSGADIESLLAALTACANAGDYGAMTGGTVLSITSAKGAVMTMEYYEERGVISVLGEYFTASDEVKNMMADNN
jgi:hypothetical protein